MNALQGAGDEPACSFCGAGTAQVEHLISGPGVWICGGCVSASYEIIQSLKQTKAASVDAALPMDDQIMAMIAQVQQLALQGQREQAASAYEQLWPQIEHGRPLHRVCLAHYMADLQDDPVEELRWDERALKAAAEITPQDTDAAAVAPLRASLHVSSARASYKLNRQEAARQQLAAARQAEQALPADGYGRLVRSQIDALSTEMDQQTLL